MKKELLEMKKELLAITLAGACVMTGCGSSEISNDTEEETSDIRVEEIRETLKRKNQFVCIYPDRAVIFETDSFKCDDHQYVFNIDGDYEYDMYVPMDSTILIKKSAPFTGEEYVRIACGPDFPIEYIRSEDYTIKR